MGSIRYSKFCNNIFRRIFQRYNTNDLEEKNIVLAQADIHIEYITYVSIALMNLIIGFIVTF